MKLPKKTYALMVLLFFFSPVLLLTFQNCSNVRLYKNPPAQLIQTTQGPFSVRPDKNSKFNKVIFVVDKSGSNFANGGRGGAGSPGNDPDNSKRGGSIDAFLETKRNDPFYKWSFIAFGVNLNQAEAYIKEGNSFVGKFGVPEEMSTALKKNRATPDNGCTPYLAGLTLAKMTIDKDLKDHPKEDSVYNVILLSDGFPNDAGAGQSGCGNLVTVQDNPNDPYIMAVNDLRSLASGKIFLSTAYYTEPKNDPDRAAGKGLSFMAKAGGGKFVDLRDGDTINFDEIITGEIPVPLKIKRMFVVNLNSGFCDDGSVDTDSDADGLCDKDELRYNSLYADKLKALKGEFNPTNRYSFKGGYSDLFVAKYSIFPGGAGLPGCSKIEGDIDFDLLNSCEEVVMKNSSRNGPTQSWTDSMPIEGADKENPDSDGDGFLDGIEWMTFKDSSTPVSFLSLQLPYAGGLKGEQIIREHRNVLSPQVFGHDQYDGNLVERGISDKGEKEYYYDQTQLALYSTLAMDEKNTGLLPDLAHSADENVILVYYIAVPENDPDGRGILYYSFQKLNVKDASTNLGLNYDSSIFKTYHVPRSE